MCKGGICKCKSTHNIALREGSAASAAGGSCLYHFRLIKPVQHPQHHRRFSQKSAARGDGVSFHLHFGCKSGAICPNNPQISRPSFAPTRENFTSAENNGLILGISQLRSAKGANMQENAPDMLLSKVSNARSMYWNNRHSAPVFCPFLGSHGSGVLFSD
jgi:hypothetical protein